MEMMSLSVLLVVFRNLAFYCKLVQQFPLPCLTTYMKFLTDTLQCLFSFVDFADSELTS